MADITLTFDVPGADHDTPGHVFDVFNTWLVGRGLADRQLGLVRRDVQWADEIVTVTFDAADADPEAVPLHEIVTPVFNIYNAGVLAANKVDDGDRPQLGLVRRDVRWADAPA